MTWLPNTRTLRACCTALLVVFLSAPAVRAQTSSGAGLVRALDVGQNTLTVETRSGSQAILVPATAIIHDDHGNPLTFGDMRPGDAVTYQVVSGVVTSLRVARQFWAIPPD